MAIKSAKDLKFQNKKIAVLIYGTPNIGKTTLALSADKPLLVDLENGVDRVEACYRQDVAVNDDLPFGERYEAFVKDLKESDLSAYNTIIIDTVDKLFDLIVPVVIKESPKNALSDGVTLSLKGYGAVSKKITSFIDLVRSLGKHIVLLSHSVEKMDGEINKVRLSIPGSTKDTIWNDIDLGGYIEYQGKKRVIGFSPTEKYYAKGVHGIKGVYEIPELKSTKDGGKIEDNHFLKDVIDTIVHNLQAFTTQYNSDLDKYNKVMLLKTDIENCKTIDELNSVFEKVKVAEHAMSSKQELFSTILLAAEQLGAKYDKETARIVQKDEQ